MDIRILVVDDDKDIADLVELYLQNEGYQVDKFLDSMEAYKSVLQRQYDIALLDIMMPGMDGFSLCRKIREEYTFPIIMLTAKIGDMDKINGLTIGADDYITKPFNPLEMVARVKAQLRRATKYTPVPQESGSRIDLLGLSIDKMTHECTVDGKTLLLTPTEFSILLILCEHAGKVVSAEELYETVWGEKSLDNNNTVMVHIRHLREKMKDNSKKPRFIKTVWGVGYKIEQ